MGAAPSCVWAHGVNTVPAQVQDMFLQNDITLTESRHLPGVERKATPPQFLGRTPTDEPDEF